MELLDSIYFQSSFHSIVSVRDSPAEVSIREFAESLRCSVDTAKRWLKTAFGSCYVKVEQTPGGRWTVTLPHGDVSLLVCRMSRQLDKFTDRKRVASKALPKIGQPKIKPTPEVGPPETEPRRVDSISQLSGADAFLIPGDVAGLIRQVSDEFGMSPEKQLEFTDAKLAQCVARVWLIRGIQALQKRDTDPTVVALADHLDISVSSLYRKPFGRVMVKAVIEAAVNAGPPQEPLRPNIPYEIRKPAFDRRREAKARHFLYWIAGAPSHEGKMASLYMAHETQIPCCAVRGRGRPLPIYHRTKLKGILSFLEDEGYDLDRFEKSLGGYAYLKDTGIYKWWCIFGGVRTGQARTWSAAAKQIIRQVSKLRTRRKLIFLNPKLRGFYRIPECIPCADGADIERQFAQKVHSSKKFNA